MSEQFLTHISELINNIRNDGLFKEERIIETPQNAHIQVGQKADLLNMCANNYLGLSDHPEIVSAAHMALDRWGYGLSSVRFICGTQSLHKTLELKISEFLGKEDTILFSSCFDANAGLFETLLNEEDAIISDELNHASIIDGIRLSKAHRFRYKNNDIKDLEDKLKQAISARFKMIATDGVFSMDGFIANLPDICEVANKHGALVMVDDSHAVGFMGKTGRGTHQYHNVIDKIDLISGTLGKALGGASGGYISGKKEVITYLRQRSRPYLFSNSLAPMIVGASIKALELLCSSTELRDKLESNTRFFRERLSSIGLNILPGEHPIVPIMLGEAKLAKEMADLMLKKGVYVIGFSYPVVPQGKARIRTQVSAAHSRDDLELAVSRFQEAGKELSIL